MGVKFDTVVRSTTIEGQEVYLKPDAPSVSLVDVTVTCDHCEKVIQWGHQDSEKLPDDAWRILTLEQFDGKRYSFCGPGCLEYFLGGGLRVLEAPERVQNTDTQD